MDSKRIELQYNELMEMAYDQMAKALGMTRDKVIEYFRQMEDCRRLVDEVRETMEPEYVTWTSGGTEMPDDTLMICKKCGTTKKVEFASCLRKGWPECCGQGMVMVTSKANIDNAVKQTVGNVPDILKAMAKGKPNA